MPAIPPPLPLMVDDLSRVRDYLGNRDHRNHRGYLIQPPVGLNLPSSEVFPQVIRDAIEVINRPRSGNEVIKVAAYWYVFSFGEGSFITGEEWSSYETKVLGVLGADRPFVLSRHEQLQSGAADLNVLDPEIRLEPFPHLDRPKTINRLYRLRHASDAWTVQANNVRRAIGKTLIPAVDPIAENSSTGLARLVRIIAEHIPDGAETFSRKQLPGALMQAGFREGDWEMSIAGLLTIRRWPNSPARKREPRPIHIPTRDLAAWVWLFLLRRQGRSKRAGRRPEASKSKDDVTHPLRTDPEVIQSADEPEI